MSELDIKSMVKKKRLNLSGMGLKEIPDQYYVLHDVTHLDVSNNNITSVDNIFASMPNLIKLDLSNNKIRKVSSDIGLLKKLVYLSLANNNINILPKSLSRLHKLKHLDLNNNPLNSEFKKIIGPTETSEECQLAAANALQYFQSDYQKDNKQQKNDKNKEIKENGISSKKVQNVKPVKKTKDNKMKLKKSVSTLTKVSRIIGKTIPYIRNFVLIAITTVLAVYGLVYYDKELHIKAKLLPIWNAATSVLHPNVVTKMENNFIQFVSSVDLTVESYIHAPIKSIINYVQQYFSKY